MKISGIILGLLLFTTMPTYSSNNDKSTKYGLVGSSVLLVYFGCRLLTRGSYSKFDKVFEVLGGSALIVAGFAGIVLSEELSRRIEKLYYM
ncbi:hypothetical protein BH09DEP1_BH09DEP1_6840 [soil metagenome]